MIFLFHLGWTPLHEGRRKKNHPIEYFVFLLAVTKNQFKAARLLLKSGAYSNAPGPEGQTPLVDAVLNNNTKVLFFLSFFFLQFKLLVSRWLNY